MHNWSRLHQSTERFLSLPSSLQPHERCSCICCGCRFVYPSLDDGESGIIAVVDTMWRGRKGDRARKSIDLAFGIVCAVEYFHNQLSVAHGLISCDTVFVTQQLSAKLLDPSAAFLLTGKLSKHAVSCAGDIKQLVQILQSLLSDICPAFLFAYDRVRGIAVGFERMEGKGDCNSLFEMKGSLDGLRQTAEYRCCPRGRHLLCQGLGEWVNATLTYCWGDCNI